MKALTAAVIVGAVAVVAGQQPAPPKPTAPAPPARRVQPRAVAPAPSTVIVRDQSGTPLADVKVSLSGPSSQQTTTAADGKAVLNALREGEYRLRFEREGFITLEREVTVAPRRPLDVQVALNLAPPPPPPPAPPPPPPPPTPPPAPQTVAAAPTAPPIFVGIPDFLDKNYIGREPLKESVMGCLSDSTTRLLQLRDALSEHTHSDMDEVLYVVAGEGTIRVRTQSSPVGPGTLAVIPHGQPHTITPRGKNPLMVISVLTGTPCRSTESAAAR